MFPVLTLFLIFILYYAYRRNKISQKEAQQKADFWERENQANSAPKKDIEHLNYITVPLDDFPIGKYPLEALREPESELTELADKKILNLTGISNTDLKLQYGVANIEYLSDYDENFTRLVRVIADYANILADNSYTEDAVRVLEFGVKIQSDVTQNYVLLASLYQARGEGTKIRSLIEASKLLNSLSKDTIQKKLNDML